MAYTDILKTIPTLQATALAAHNAKFAAKKKITTKSLIKTGATNIVGTSLIKSTAGLI